jgi:hypothetical protein
MHMVAISLFSTSRRLSLAHLSSFDELISLQRAGSLMKLQALPSSGDLIRVCLSPSEFLFRSVSSSMAIIGGIPALPPGTGRGSLYPSCPPPIQWQMPISHKKRKTWRLNS